MSDSTITVSTAKGKTLSEKGYMFTESKIYHIEDLLTMAHDIEKPTLKKYIPNIIMAIGIFIMGFGVTSLLNIKFQLMDASYSSSISLLWIFSAIGLIMSISGYCIDYAQRKEYECFATKALLIIKKAKEEQE